MYCVPRCQESEEEEGQEMIRTKRAAELLIFPWSSTVSLHGVSMLDDPAMRGRGEQPARQGRRQQLR